ncbi:GNAT family N-acetyltransferase [Salipaludibacillus sp. LMS25]|jgi:ribosomal-protein-alanine N-acetyltransferase|uniref:GNAT family N-acetyltransferase n=1 Tax=Salipaludibacillus sp. LMS25 TaxID=2924031 RepID=UPI0020D05E55|nr:GNAT family protein [Salipaludibacillus sp. LMS25]UTR14806.1 GNAT family N-acetyltransferase [Salipaludibacillus sp. LMS25]
MISIKDIYADLPTLTTDRLKLRKITLEDTEDMFHYASDEEISRYVTWDTHPSLKETKAFIDHILIKYENNELAPWGIVLKKTNNLIGTIDFVNWSTTHRVAEIAYALSRQHWGDGLMTEAAEAVVKFGFQSMDLIRIEAKCFDINRGSARVMEKVGMRYEGTMRQAMIVKGKPRNLLLYAILKDDK